MFFTFLSSAWLMVVVTFAFIPLPLVCDDEDTPLIDCASAPLFRKGISKFSDFHLD